MKIIIEFWLKDGKIKKVTKQFPNREKASRYLAKIKGENFVAYLEDGSLAIYVGYKIK